jgi:hypothetical protein
MTEVRQKCSEVYPSDPGTPFYNQCWGFRELPNEFNFRVEGFRSILPGVDCNYLGKGPYEGVMTRMGACSFNYGWSNGEFGILLSMNENKPPLSTKIDQNSADLTRWRVGGSLTEKSKTGACVMTDPPLGKVTFELSGVIGSDICEADFRIWVQE